MTSTLLKIGPQSASTLAAASVGFDSAPVDTNDAAELRRGPEEKWRGIQQQKNLQMWCKWASISPPTSMIQVQTKVRERDLRMKLNDEKRLLQHLGADLTITPKKVSCSKVY